MDNSVYENFVKIKKEEENPSPPEATTDPTYRAKCWGFHINEVVHTYLIGGALINLFALFIVQSIPTVAMLDNSSTLKSVLKTASGIPQQDLSLKSSKAVLLSLQAG